MNIDKVRFLLVTTTLAAASGLVAANTIVGCSSSTASATDAGATPTDSGTQSDTSVVQTESGSDAAAACLPQGDGGAGDPFSDCAALMGYCGPSCEGMALDLDLAPGNALLACMKSKLTTDACSTSQAANALVATCMGEVVAQTCPDPTTDALCSAAVADCQLDDAGADGGAADAGTHPFNKATCMQYTSTLSGRGRATFDSCIKGTTGASACSDCFAGW